MERKGRFPTIHRRRLRLRVADEARRAARHLALLERVIRGGGAGGGTAEMADRAAKELCEVFDGVHIALHVVTGDRLELIARRYEDGSSRLDVAPDWLRSIPLDAPGSIIARAVNDRRVQNAPIAELMPRAVEVLRAEGVARLIVAPLLVADSAVGTLSVATHAEAWNREQKRLLGAVTTRLAGEILHARMLEEERKRARDLALINEIGGVIAQQLDLDAVLDIAVRELARVVEVPRVAVSLVDDERKFLVTVAAASKEPFPQVQTAVDGPGAVPLAYRSRRPVVIADARNDERTLRAPVHKLGIQSLFCVPLIANGNAIGAILLAETRRPRRFSDEEIARATAVANLISPAIVNAKMFADLRKSYEALSVAQKELVTHERLAALGELSAVIAHEVRNPLAIIFNSLGTLRKLAAPTDDAKVLLDIVGEEAARLNRIVADLLDFVRPYSSHPKPANIEALVRGAVDGARRALSMAGAHVEADLSASAPELVLDATMIQQALLNLIVNAIQATPPGGRVTVRTTTAVDEAKTSLSLEVSDEGPGIDPADAGRIFQPFFTTKPTGTGLGLAVVRRIAEALGGSVHVRSGEPRGAVFTLTIPAVTA